MFLQLISLGLVWGLDKFSLVAFSLHSDYIRLTKSASILKQFIKKKNNLKARQVSLLNRFLISVAVQPKKYRELFKTGQVHKRSLDDLTSAYSWTPIQPLLQSLQFLVREDKMEKPTGPKQDREIIHQLPSWTKQAQVRK